MADVIIDIQDLSVGFTGRNGAERAVLRNIDLQVRRGETVGLVGESGSGKSTLALAAMGYLKTGLRLLGGQALFAGESMFHHVSDASKVAVVRLLEYLHARGYVLFDTQMLTETTRSLGAVEITRIAYLERLMAATDLPVTFGVPPGNSENAN